MSGAHGGWGEAGPKSPQETLASASPQATAYARLGVQRCRHARRVLPSNLRAAFHGHGHLLTYTAVLSCGVTPKQLRTLVTAGAVVRVRQGVYACGERWRAASDHAGRGLLEARAASLTMTHPHVLSHDSAAHALGLPFLAPRMPLVHVTRPDVRGGRTCSGVKHHGAPHRLDQVVPTGAGEALDLPRTAVDLVREHGIRIGLGACDAALRRGVRASELAAAARPMTNWRGVRTVRLALGWADPGADNPGESLARLAVLETGLGRPATQFPVRLRDRLAWCDMLLGSHVIEFDGYVKYLPPERGGVADRDPGEVAWAERQRERELMALGLGHSRLVWEDLLPRRWDATVRRLHREISATHARAGARTPPALLAFADRLQATRTARIFGRPFAG